MDTTNIMTPVSRLHETQLHGYFLLFCILTFYFIAYHIFYLLNFVPTTPRIKPTFTYIHGRSTTKLYDDNKTNHLYVRQFLRHREDWCIRVLPIQGIKRLQHSKETLRFDFKEQLLYCLMPWSCVAQCMIEALGISQFQGKAFVVLTLEQTSAQLFPSV